MKVTLTKAEARQIIRTHDLLVQWVRDHEELCEERMALLALERSIRSAGRILDQMESAAASRRA